MARVATRQEPEEGTRQQPRHEVKMVLEEGDLHDARTRIATAPQGLRRQHPSRDIWSIYFDTEGLDTYWSNLGGSSQRHKIRLRWYASADPGATVRFEVKRKVAFYGWKLVEEVPAPDLTQPWPAVVVRLARSLAPESAVWLREHGRPVLANRYRREYYASFDGRVRVTLDSGNTVYDQMLAARPNLTRSAPPSGLAVLEGKAAWSDRDLLELVLQRFPYRVSRNSKYLNGVDAIHGIW
jgi:SPX domain protein involved in polyphosphate accumulation